MIDRRLVKALPAVAIMPRGDHFSSQLYSETTLESSLFGQLTSRLTGHVLVDLQSKTDYVRAINNVDSERKD